MEAGWDFLLKVNDYLSLLNSALEIWASCCALKIFTLDTGCWFPEGNLYFLHFSKADGWKISFASLWKMHRNCISPCSLWPKCFFPLSFLFSPLLCLSKILASLIVPNQVSSPSWTPFPWNYTRLIFPPQGHLFFGSVLGHLSSSKPMLGDSNFTNHLCDRTSS